MIRKNNITVNQGEGEGSDAIDLLQPPWIPPIYRNSFKVVITQNKFTLNDAFYGGIYGANLDDVVITNNIFRGTSGYEAINTYAESWFDELTTGWRLIGNNFQKLETMFGVDLILRPWQRDWFVVGGGNNKENVIDVPVFDLEGNPIDKNNSITGVNIGTLDPIGPEIKDAMKLKSGMMQMLP